MATILLSAAGAAIGGSLGGTVLGLSMTAIGRLAGATLGRSLDQRLLGQGSDAVETGRVERLRLTGTGEGDPIAQIYGRMRVAGHVIWASQFVESVATSGGGKGISSKPKTSTYSYSVSLAIALCEGEITHVGRVWADGVEIPRDDLGMRVYTGAGDQLPDPKIEAVEGVGMAPAYRGTAYVVLEDLALEQFGNRIPLLTFEVSRPQQSGSDGADADLAHGIKAVAMLPGSGEYALATTPVTFDYGVGNVALANVNTPSGKSDFSTSVQTMAQELPECGSTSLIVSWFGDDLRCGTCLIQPKAEQDEFDGKEMPWVVSGQGRSGAALVARDIEDRPVYGGTPSDASVIEAIHELQANGQAVMFYPFILMDQLDGNTLSDPWSDAETQPKLPWRGRISLSKSAGQVGSPDGTAAADIEVSDFFGTASATDFTIVDEDINYNGPSEWRYRRFILHNAALCAAAGGVDSFCIGSEMRGLTQIRGASGIFRAVVELQELAGEVRAILGPDTKIGYAADWTEYFGFQPQDGTADRYFHLDPLWADADIDFIGIDNYMPLSDWRDGEDHTDADWGSIYNLDYLKANIEGGEGYDWYYHSPEAQEAQIRTDIEDGAHDEAWIYRYKDIRNWWSQPHHERIGGVRSEAQTAWEPQSKPIWFSELGCAAINKGTNEPNKFLDPKSSESQLPKYSNGMRDEFLQMQYLRAMFEYWGDTDNNPVSIEYDAPMIDMTRAHVWAWDARPFPFFPANSTTWSDSENYARGHWITGRVSARSLASVVDEICARAGVEHCDTSVLYGHVRGYVVGDVGDARAALQPLLLRFGFDAVERDGVLHFCMRDGIEDRVIESDFVAISDDIDGTIEQTRSSEADLAGRVRLRFVQAEADFEVLAEEAVLPDQQTHAVSSSEIAMSLTRGEGRQVVERWLSEARIGRDTVRFALPPSRLDVGAGDVVRLRGDGIEGLYRVDTVEQGSSQNVEAVRIEPETYRPVATQEDAITLREFHPPVPVFPLFMDLPLITGEETPHAPHLAITAQPWPGSVALYGSDSDDGYALNQIIAARSIVGVTETAMFAAKPGLYDHGAALQVKLTSGQLESISELALLNGGNLAAIGDGTPGNWEVFQFRDATLLAEDTYLLSHRLRGQLGSDALAPNDWPVGSYFVVLNGVPAQISLASSSRGNARHYRVGTATRGYDDPSYTHLIEAFDGIGLRPYSPCHLLADRTSGGDIDVSWIRRTRIDGDSWTSLEVPLGEESESYLVRVLKNGNIARETFVSTPTWQYSTADQTSDAISMPYEISVAQVSTQFGAGAPEVIEIIA